MFQWLIDKCQSIKRDYLRRSPKGKWLAVRNGGIFILRVTGVPVLDPNFKINWLSYSAGIVIVDVSISFVYTVWYFLHRDFVKGLLNIPLYFGVLLPVIYLLNLKFIRLILINLYHSISI